MKSIIKLSLILVGISLLIPTVIDIYDFSLNLDIFVFEALSLYYVLTGGLLIPLFIPVYLEDKYGMDEKMRIIGTYQYFTKIFTIWIVSLMYLVFVGSHYLGFFSNGILCSVFFVVPVLSLIFGSRLFNDSSCHVDGEILFGYPPIYPVVSLIVGIFGFNFILNSPTNLDAVLTITLIIQIILVLPNLANRILPFEIRTKKGCAYFITLTIIVYVALIFLTMDGEMFNSTNTVINYKTILENILLYGTGMIIVYLFFKQAQKMNKKKK
ncbi:hypothetical protein [Methanobrevibacter sp.]|uniref:hypothetical protein n=1 Tax=Methanobrevibacter sp. TaxID=66852 RepID=UPI0025F481AA|nr:hypothetical protein [Methanobrevibacter sp.]MBQ2665373.1 hypothetical protein [Methanobrevibacter sp.]